MVKLKRLKINKYRNVRPGTELRFDDGFNLVLGKNGGGKTTLLGLIAHVLSQDFSSMQDEVFSLEYELTDGDRSLRASIEGRGRPARTDDSGLPVPSRPDYQYTLELRDLTTLDLSIRGTPQRTELETSTTALDVPVQSLFEPYFAAIVVFYRHKHRLNSLDQKLLSAYPVFRFDEALECFHSLVGRRSPRPGVATPPPMTLSVTGRAGKASMITGQFVPYALGVPLFGHGGAPGGELHFSLGDHGNVPPSFAFLDTAGRLIGALEATCRPASKKLEERGTEVSLEVEGLEFSFKRANGITLDQDRLSYGQKRLLTFFYYLTVHDTFVIADELVNGLHHQWIAACMDAIGERQAFLTSQNPLLFDYIPDFESAAQLQSCFITCKTEVVDGAEEIVWQNMSEDDADRMFESYRAEIQPLGEILITRGLW